MMTKRMNVARLAAALAVVAAASLGAATAPVSAAPAAPADDGGPSTMSTSCGVGWDRAHTYYSVQCSSTWPWEGFDYYAWVLCSDGLYRFGSGENSWFDDDTSTARCPAGTYWTNAGRG